mmetsp:Transcript_25627/g.38051  ORF Transcript_25627/g.38051 Transcript_25627/m.38051 type:complete len:145 (+) Transcript_25627:370-804(+)
MTPCIFRTSITNLGIIICRICERAGPFHPHCVQRNLTIDFIAAIAGHCKKHSNKNKYILFHISRSSKWQLHNASIYSMPEYPEHAEAQKALTFSSTQNPSRSAATSTQEVCFVFTRMYPLESSPQLLQTIGHCFRTSSLLQMSL